MICEFRNKLVRAENRICGLDPDFDMVAETGIGEILMHIFVLSVLIIGFLISLPFVWINRKLRFKCQKK